MAALSNSGCIVDLENSIPNKFAKDQRPYKFDDLHFAMECPVDFESLGVNGFPEVKTRFEKQGMLHYFDILNGPTYNEFVKEFWMKATIITKAKYQDRLKELIAEKPEFYGKTPAEMGLRPFVSTEIESYVSGFRVAIRLAHIYEALKLTEGGLFLKTTDSVEPEVKEFIFKPKENPEDKTEWKNLSKIIYRILINSIISKLGGTDQISFVQKLFTYHVGKGNFVDIGKFIFIHLADSISHKQPIIRHGRLLSHMFAQCGLLDALRPFFLRYGTFLLSSKIINSTTLRYLKLLVGKKAVYPTHPLLLRDSEEGIDECRLIHVSDSGARKIAEAHAGFLKSLGAEVGSGETQDLTVRQARNLAQPTKITTKRKAVKSPGVAKGKKVAKTKKSDGPKATRKPRRLILDATEEEKEEALKDNAVAQVEALLQKEESLKDGYECGIDASVFDEMYSKLKLQERDALRKASSSIGMYGPADAQATTSTAPVIHLVDENEDSERTPSPPPQKSPTNKEISNQDPTPEPEDTHPQNNQEKPQSPQPQNNQDTSQSPQPENNQNNPPLPPPILEQTLPTSDSHKSPGQNDFINPNSEDSHKEKSPIITVDKSPHHVVDNTVIEELPNNQQPPPNHITNPDTLMQDLANDCIFIPPFLPSRILNEPMDETKEDIAKMLKAVDKNIRRLQNAIPTRSIESAEIDKECELMEVRLQNMIRAIRVSYKKDLEFRNEMARIKAEQERKEAEERERKRLEEERLEKERIEALAREQARLAEEARVAADQERL
ncbi:hypothetical protein QL285_004202 [Trifolium repens]|nr:hypothetical protein QL285_004202 [Trifolium repens]